MTTSATATTPINGSVRKSIVVRTDVDRAFRLFTDGLDSWWPRSHHIGKSPMTKALIEGHAGGRCYSLQEDGTDCQWGSILVWEPPHRFVMAWQITHECGSAMRTAVDSPGGWETLLQLFAERVHAPEQQGR